MEIELTGNGMVNLRMVGAVVNEVGMVLATHMILGNAFPPIIHLPSIRRGFNMSGIFGRRTNVVAVDYSGDRRAAKRPHHRTHGKHERQHERHERDREGRREVGKELDAHRSVQPEGVVAEWVEVVANPGVGVWRKHPVVENWMKDNLRGVPRLGAGSALVVVGPRLAGKTRWARSLGEHAYVVGLHCAAAVDVCNEGYVVCDDLTKGYPYAKQLLTCQPVVSMARDDGVVVQKKWGKPCIWVCDQWDDPRRWSPEMAGFVSQACTVFDMNEHGWKTFYVEDDGDADEEAVDTQALSEEEEGKEEEGEEEKEKEKPALKQKKVVMKVDDALEFFC